MRFSVLFMIIWWCIKIPPSCAFHSNHSVAILVELSFLKLVSSRRLVKDPVGMSWWPRDRARWCHILLCSGAFLVLCLDLLSLSLSLILVLSFSWYRWEMMLGPPTIFFLNKEYKSLFFSSNREKMPDSRVVKRYVKVTPGIEIPCLNMSIFLYFQNVHIFSRASQKGWTSTIGDKIVETLYLNRVTMENKRIRPLPCPLHSKLLCCFL